MTGDNEELGENELTAPYIMVEETVSYKTLEGIDFFGSYPVVFSGADTVNEGTITSQINVDERQVFDSENSESEPIATNDSETTSEGTSVIINVLANDIDPDGDSMTVASVTQGNKGSVTINEDNTITYTPNEDETGTDSFTYTITDGNGGQETANVTVTIEAENESPLAVDDTASTAEETAVTIDVLANDTDGDGDTLTVSSVTQGVAGSVQINADNTVTYTPDAGAAGTDSFTYIITDGNGGAGNGQCDSNH